MSNINEILKQYATNSVTPSRTEARRRPGYLNAVREQEGIALSEEERAAEAAASATDVGIGMIMAQQDRDDYRSMPEREGDVLIGGLSSVANMLGGAAVIANELQPRNIARRAGDVIQAGARAMGRDLTPEAQAAYDRYLPRVSGGAEIARATGAVTDFIERGYSDKTEGQLGREAIRSEVQGQENDRLRDSRGGGVIAGAAHLYDEARSGAVGATQSPAMLDRTIGQTAGSLLTAAAGGAVVSGTVKVGASALAARGFISQRSAMAAAQAVERNGIHFVMAGMEGGGSTIQVMEHVRNMTPEQMAAEPLYASLIEQGVPPAEAKIIVMESAGRVAGAITGVVSVGITKGLGMGDMITAPIARRALSANLANIGKETIEETAQGGSSALAGNIGLRVTGADTRQGLMEGVGEAMGQGMVGGMMGGGMSAGGSTAVTGAAVTGAVADATITGARNLGDRMNEYAQRTGEKVSEWAGKGWENISRVGERMAKNADTARETMTRPVTEPVEEGTPAEADTTDLDAVFDRVSRHLVDGDYGITSSLVQETTEGAGVQALAAIAGRLKADQSLTEEQRDELSLAALDIQQKVQATIDNDLPQLTDIPKESAKALQSLSRQMTSVLERPEMRTSLADAQRRRANLAKSEDLTNPTVARAVIEEAKANPSKADDTRLGLILEHSERGELDLTDLEKRLLTGSIGLVRAIRENNEWRENLALARTAKVSFETTANREAGRTGLSAEGHARKVMDAMKDGDVKGAASALQDLGMFAQHLRNRIGAFNTSYTAMQNKGGLEKQVPHDSWSARTKEWTKNGSNAYINMFSRNAQNTVAAAQQAHADTQRVHSVLNALAEAFPELGVQPVASTELHPDLIAGPAGEVIQNYRKAGRPSQAPVASNSESASQNQRGEPAEVPAKKVEEAAPAEARAAVPVQESTFDEDAAYDEERAWRDSISAQMAEISERLKKAEDTPQPVETVQDDETEAAPVQEQPDEDLAGPVADVAQPTMEELYGDLITPPVGNRFTQSFRMRANSRSRFIYGDRPYADLINNLNDAEKTQELTGVAVAEPVRQAYRKLLSLGVPMVAFMEKRLNGALTSPTDMDGTSLSLVERMTQGEDALRMTWARALNLAQETEVDGVRQYRYHPRILAAALTAGMSYVARHAVSGRKKSAEEVAKELSISQDLLEMPENRGFVDDMNQGLFLDLANLEMSREIMDMLGIEVLETARRGEADAVIYGLALETLAALRDQGLVTIKAVSLRGENGKVIKTWHQVKVNETALPDHTDEAPSPVAKRPELLSQMVTGAVSPYDISLEPSGTTTQSRQMAHRAPLTDAQLDQIVQEESRQNFLNEVTAPLLTENSEEILQTVFGEVLPEPGGEGEKKYNKSHLLSMRGRNRVLHAARTELLGIRDRLDEARGDQSIWAVPFFAPYGITRMGRIQALNRASAQGNKLMRMAVSSTRAVVDLSDQNSNMMGLFRRGVGQSLGLKVQKMDDWEIQAELFETLQDLKPTTEVISNLLASGSMTMTQEQADIVRANLGEGAPVDPAAFGALTDYVRYEIATAEEKKTFRVDVYIEADGITDGAFYGLLNLSLADGVNKEWLGHVARAGLSLHTNSDQPLNHAEQKQAAREAAGVRADEQSLSDLDMYDVTGNSAANSMLGHIVAHSTPDTDPQVRKGVRAVADLLGKAFGSKQVMFSDDENNGLGLELHREQVKQPMMMTLYGGGARGVAKGIAGNLIREVQKRLTTGLQAMEAMGVNDAWVASYMVEGMDRDQAEASATRLRDLLFSLSSNRVMGKDSRKGAKIIRGAWMKKNPPKKLNFDPVEFSMPASNFQILADNIHDHYAKHLFNGVRTTLGETTDGIDLIIQATNMIANHASLVLNAVVASKQAELKAKGIPANRGFTREEEKDIIQSVSHLLPHLEGEDIRIWLGSLGRDISGPTIAHSMEPDGKKRLGASAPLMALPELGVSGAPVANIGFGDAQTIMRAAQKMAFNLLMIFDGVNLPLDKAQEGARALNQSVWESVQAGGPIEALSRLVDNIGDNYDFNKYSISDEMAAHILGAKLEEYLAWREENPQVDVAKALNNRWAALRRQVKTASAKVKARKAVIAEARFSMDHMSAADGAWANQGSKDLTGMTLEEQASLLNDRYEEVLPQFLKEENLPVREPIDDNITEELSSIGEVVDNVGVITASDLLDNYSSLAQGMDRESAGLFEVAAKALQAEGYKILTGSRTALKAYAKARGINYGNLFKKREGRMEDIHGATLPDDRTIMLMKGSAETMLHEAIHAVTIHSTVDYFLGSETQSEMVKEAFGRLVSLQNQWLDSETVYVNAFTLEAQSAYRDAKAAVQKHLAAAAKAGSDTTAAAKYRAAALNEFMAWNLSNQALIDAGQKLRVNPVARIVGDALKAIRQVIGRLLGRNPNANFYSALRFNTEIVMEMPTADTITLGLDPLQQARATSDVRTENLLEKLAVKLGALRASMESVRKDGWEAADDFMKRQAGNMLDYTDALEIEEAVRLAGFQMDDLQSNLFKTVLTLTRADALVSPEGTRLLDRVYRKAVADLAPADFHDGDWSTATEAEQTKAARMYEILAGVHTPHRDRWGRTMALPMFAALAASNDQVRILLAKVEMPELGKPEPGKNMDEWLEGRFEHLTERMERAILGTGNEALSALSIADQALDVVLEQENALKAKLNKGADVTFGVINKVNDAVSWGLKKTLDAGLAATAAMRKAAAGTPNASFINKIATAAELILKAFHVERHEEAGRALMTLLNTAGDSAFVRILREIATEFIGIDESNADVLEMIKQVGSLSRQSRQLARIQIPRSIMKAFNVQPTKEQWASLFRSLGKTDLAVLVNLGMPVADVLNLFKDASALSREADRVASEIGLLLDNPVLLSRIKVKSSQLAQYMNTGKVGVNLLRNASQIANLNGEQRRPNLSDVSKARLEAMVDKLVTLYAIQNLDMGDRTLVAEMSQTEAAGLGTALDLMVVQREIELSKPKSTAWYNRVKGYMPTERNGTIMTVLKDKVPRGFEVVGEYTGTRYLDRGPKTPEIVYVKSNLKRPPFQQGLLQSVVHTVGGVEVESGRMRESTSGGAYKPMSQERREQLEENDNWVDYYAQLESNFLADAMNDGTNVGPEPVIAHYDENGAITHFERMMDPSIVQANVQEEGHLAESIGMWAGRSIEERVSNALNERAMVKLQEMYDKSTRKDEFIDVLKSKDPIHRAAVAQMNPTVLHWIKENTGGQFMVRKDMVDNVVGYPAPSLSEIFGGPSRMPKQVRETLEKAANIVLGPKAYERLMAGEQAWTRLMAEARVAIVVKSLVVPAFNMLSNIHHLMMVGVPPHVILRELPRKQAEVTTFLKNREVQHDLEVQLQRAKVAKDTTQVASLQSRLNALRDANRRLSIWPLLKAGHFSPIADGLTREDLALAQGKWMEHFERVSAKTPNAAKTALRYGFVSKDTPLFSAMARATSYGDFLGRAILFDHAVSKLGLTEEEALRRADRDFINYDMLPGRFRAWGDRFGLTWFHNFKIRAVKPAMGMIRENPLHLVLAGASPLGDIAGSVLDDNILNLLADGRFENSLGIWQALRGLNLLPPMQVVNAAM